MSTQTRLFALLAAVAVGAAWWMLLYTPLTAGIDEAREQADTVRTQTATAERNLQTLRQVDEQADELEAIVDAADEVVPTFLPDGAVDPAELTASQLGTDTFLRQLASVADRAGVQWDATEVTGPQVPATLSEDHPELARTIVSVTLSGSYSQLSSFLDRTVDRELMRRGVVWSDVSVSSASVDGTTDEYVLSGTIELYSALHPTADEDEDGDSAGDDGD